MTPTKSEASDPRGYFPDRVSTSEGISKGFADLQKVLLGVLVAIFQASSRVLRVLESVPWTDLFTTFPHTLDDKRSDAGNMWQLLQDILILKLDSLI